MPVLVSIMALAIGVSLFALPSPGQAVTISTISVTDSAGGNYTGDNSGSATNTWNFAPITLNPGESLILTQNQNGVGNSNSTSGLPGFNFDSSEPGGVKGTQYTVTVNGGSQVDTSGNLHDHGNDLPGSTSQNETSNWVKIGGVAGSYDLYVGYADTLHSDACKDGAGVGTCLPFDAGATDPNTKLWINNDGGATKATYVIGNPTTLNGYTGTTTHCNFNAPTNDPTQWNCYDSGAILIVATVPEPSTVLLVGTLIIGLTGWGLRRNRRTI
jgi:hypothetical protein